MRWGKKTIETLRVLFGLVSCSLCVVVIYFRWLACGVILMVKEKYLCMACCIMVMYEETKYLDVSVEG